MHMHSLRVDRNTSLEPEHVLAILEAHLLQSGNRTLLDQPGGAAEKRHDALASGVEMLLPAPRQVRFGRHDDKGNSHQFLVQVAFSVLPFWRLRNGVPELELVAMGICVLLQLVAQEDVVVRLVAAPRTSALPGPLRPQRTHQSISEILVLSVGSDTMACMSCQCGVMPLPPATKLTFKESVLRTVYTGAGPYVPCRSDTPCPRSRIHHVPCNVSRPQGRVCRSPRLG